MFWFLLIEDLATVFNQINTKIKYHRRFFHKKIFIKIKFFK